MAAPAPSINLSNSHIQITKLQSTQTTVFLQYMLRNNLEVINLIISTFTLYHCWDAQTNPIFSWICHIHTAIFWLDVAISGKCAPFLPTSLLDQIVRALVLCHLDNRLGSLGICFQRATPWAANCTKSGSETCAGQLFLGPASPCSSESAKC